MGAIYLLPYDRFIIVNIRELRVSFISQKLDSKTRCMRSINVQHGGKALSTAMTVHILTMCKLHHITATTATLSVTLSNFDIIFAEA